MSEYKETSVLHISKECFAHLTEDIGFREYIVKRLSSELTERIMSILEQEEEIIVRQSDLCVSEFMPTNSVEYRRQINWIPLIRCKDCKYADEYCHCSYTTWWNRPDDFCSRAERRIEDDET